MSARKKKWPTAALSELAGIESNNNRTGTEQQTATKIRRSTRNTASKAKDNQPIRKSIKADNGSTHTVTEVIVVDDEDKEDVQQPKENWMDVFAPASTEELAVQPKKVEELKKWFQHCEYMRKQKKQPAQICLLTGPSGCGKTAAVRAVAKELEYTIKEWINPVDQEMVYNLGDHACGESRFMSSQVTAFKEYLFKASRYRSLFDDSSSKRLLMIEDFPNFLLRDSSSFEEILDKYVAYGKSPLIFIVTDARRRGLNISYNLFSDQLKQKFLINHICFNPVASTLMQKAMKRICDLMLLEPHSKIYRPPTAQLLDSIIFTAQGDVRNALVNVHFASLKGAPHLLIEKSKDTKTSARKQKPQSALKSVGRDDSLTMMHALGRVFNPKYTDAKRFVHTPEGIAEAFTSEPRTFIDLIHANYLSRFSDVESVSSALNGISLCDMMLNEYRDDTLTVTALNIGIRNVMVANEKPLTGWLPIKGPKRLNPDESKIPLKAHKFLPTHHNISKSLYALEYKTLVNILN